MFTGGARQPGAELFRGLSLILFVFHLIFDSTQEKKDIRYAVLVQPDKLSFHFGVATRNTIKIKLNVISEF